MTATLVELGNPAAKFRDGSVVAEGSDPVVTYVHIPDTYVLDSAAAAAFDERDVALHLLQAPDGITHLPGLEPFLAVAHPGGLWGAHSASQPSWVHSDDEALASILSRFYNAPIGRPDDIEDTHWTRHGMPGVGPDPLTDVVALKTNAGNDIQAHQMFGFASTFGQTGTATATTATTLTGGTEAPGGSHAANDAAGMILVAGAAYGLVLSNTSGTTPVYTVDRWYVPGCVDEETEILTADGWKNIDTIRKGDLVLGLDHEGSGLTRWERIEALNIFAADRRPMLEINQRHHNSLTTPQHRWPIESADYRVRKTATSFDLNSKSYGYGCAPCATLPDEVKWSDSFVALVGWFCTEGSIETSHGKPCNNVRIHQSTVNPDHVERIRAALLATFGPAVHAFPRLGRTLPDQPMWRESAPTNRPQERVFHLNSVAGAMLQDVAPDRIMRPDFVTTLTAAQLDLLWQTWKFGDGINPKDGVSQVDRARLEPLQLALCLRGVSSALYEAASGQWILQVHATNRRSLNCGKRWTTYEGRVWCPTTPSGFWLARRRGMTFITGNSPGGAAAATPGATSTYVLIAGSPPAWFVGLTATATAPGSGDTTLAGEITTAGGGLIRKIAPLAHSAGTNTQTLTPVYTANGTDTLPVTVAKIGVSQSLLAGANQLFQTLLNATATLSASGDQLTCTSTITM